MNRFRLSKQPRLALAVTLVTASLGLGTSIPSSHAAGPQTQRVNHPSEIAAAGFPAYSSQVYRDARGNYSRLVTAAEIVRDEQEQAMRADAERRYAASVPDGMVRLSSLFGSSNTSTQTISAASFSALRDFKYSLYYGDPALACNFTSNSLRAVVAPVDLPSGALLTQAVAAGRDTSAARNPSFSIRKNCVSGTGRAASTITTFASPAGFAGGNYTLQSGAMSETVDNAHCTYAVRISFANNCTINDGHVWDVKLKFKRQISPDPATTTFSDVTTGHIFHREVEALVSAGITGGCGNGRYCPDQPVTRGQMAAFLSRALGLAWNNN